MDIKKSAPHLEDVGEFGLIGLIAGKVPATPNVPIGIGDDAAALRCSADKLVLSTSDMLIEGVHFDLSFTSPFNLGRKSLAVNLSDIASMGGRPLYFLLSLAIPPSCSVPFLTAFIDGMLSLAKEHEVVLVGGDTCSSLNGLVISITVYGEQSSDRIVRRCGASVDDLVFVTGTLGDSTLGLELLKRGETAGYSIERHLNPKPRVLEGQALAENKIPSAMIDISDGLVSDLKHIAEESSVGAVLFLEKLPVSSSYVEYYGNMPLTNYVPALTGGEDYELLFTAPPTEREAVHALFNKLKTQVSEIGRIIPDSGIRLISGSGTEVILERSGYDHFQYHNRRCQ